MSKTLYLIDGYAQIFRAFYAIRNGMTSPVTGEPTHAVFGFTRMLHKIYTHFQPDYLAVALDAPGPTFRSEMYAEYKANRPPMPEDLVPQIPRITELLDLYGVPVLSQPGYEADDIIATVVKQVQASADQNIRIKIVSRDKDLEQLLTDSVELFDVHKETTIDEVVLLDERGIRPDQVIDLLALMGDSADNIPGVKGIGPKTAAQLLQQYGTIDNLYNHIDEIRGKRRENLIAARDQLPLTRSLVTLRTDADVSLDLHEAKLTSPDVKGILQVYQQLGFRRHQDEVRAIARQFADEAHAQSSAASAAKVEIEKRTVKKGRYELVVSPEQLSTFLSSIPGSAMLSIDTETTGLHLDAELCGISLAWQEGYGIYIPLLSPTPEHHMDAATAFQLLRPVLEDRTIPKCGHNVKFDSRILLRAGITLRGIQFDTLLASQLLEPERTSHRLDNLVYDLLGYKMKPIKELLQTVDGEERTMAHVPLEDIADYAAEDADMTLRLYNTLRPAIEAKGMTTLLTEVEAPLTGVLASMEHHGILCDAEELVSQENVLTEQLRKLEHDVYVAAGEPFNIDSPKQLAHILFDKLDFTPVKKTKTGYSTDSEVLTRLSDQEHPHKPHSALPRLVLEYRELMKLISTYFRNLRHAIQPTTGRIHTTFQQLVTATGRLASNDPNLQNIPIRTETGRQIRRAFVASPHHTLLSADYSQIELRILAHVSEDPGLIEAFTQNDDIHASVASRVFRVPPEQVNTEQRSRAKTINFGIIYGITAYGLTRRIPDLSMSEATQLINDYKKRFAGIEQFLQECTAQAEDAGYVTTLLGRRRSIPQIRSTNRNVKGHGERMAINTVVQGSAADLIKVAMVRIAHRLAEEDINARLLLQIHDELVFEVADEHVTTLRHIVKEEMEHALTLRVPLKAEIGAGPNWLDLQPVAS